MNFKVSVLLILLIKQSVLFAQNSILVNAHSHNDYKQKHPLHQALSLEFRSIEADIFLVKNELIVSHTYPIFKNKKTLSNLYLQPLFDSVQKNGFIYKNYPHSIILLIDIKSDAAKTYTALKQELINYKSVLTSVENGKIIERAITIVLSGNKPYAQAIADTNRFMFIDENLLMLKNCRYDSTLCYMASTKYRNVLKWKGKGAISKQEQKRIKALVQLAHQQGKIVRLWAMPKNENVWLYMLNENIDLLNVDDLKRLSNFLLEQKK
jgi:hypothetical protein